MMLAHALALGAGGRVGYTFTDSAAAAYVAAMTVQPSNQRKQHIDALFTSLRSSGVLAKLSHLYLLAAHDSQAAGLNASAPGTNTLAAVNSPTFTADRGYQGDGSTSYLNTGVNLSGGGGLAVQDSHHFSVWTRTESSANATEFGGSDISVGARDVAGFLASRSAATTADSVTVASSVGHSLISRTASTGYARYRNGSALSAAVRTSAAFASQSLFLGARNNGAGAPMVFSARQISALTIGSGLDATESAALYTALNTYMQAVGAA